MVMMKRVLLVLLALVAFNLAAIAGDKNKKTTAESTKEIKWMNFDEVQAAMKKEPRKVLIDFYTGWCGWCKVMDKKTYTNPDLVDYVNKNFYAVKFDAESKDSIRFMGKMYGFAPEMRAHALAAELMQGRLSYPTTVFFTENNFQAAAAVPGYQAVPAMETILKYLGENHHKTTKWEDFQKEFKPAFKDDPSISAAPASGVH